MPPWLVTLLSGGVGTAFVTGLYRLLRHHLDLRLFRHTYDEGGADDMVAASQAVHLRDPAVLERVRSASGSTDGPSGHWQYEYVAESDPTPTAIHGVWRDLATWPAWHPSVRSISADGPLEPGTTLTIIRTGQDAPLIRTVVACVPDGGFTDRFVVDRADVVTHHVVEPTESGSRVTCRIVVTGPRCDEIGPRIAAEVPDVVTALITAARPGR